MSSPPRQDRAARAVVLHVFGELRPHGAELRTVELLEEVQRHGGGFDHGVLSLSPSAGVLRERFERAGAFVVAVPARSWSFPVVFLRTIVSRRVAVVHSHVDALSGFVLFWAWLFRVPGRVGHLRTEAIALRKGRVGKLVDAALIRALRVFSTELVGVSPSALGAASGPHRRRESVVLSGIDLDRLAQARSRDWPFEVPEGAKVVLHVGRDTPVKNRELAIRIFRSEFEHCDDWHLVFVGSGPVLDDASNIHYLGERKDAPDLMRSSDLLLSTSRGEGLPGAVLEGALLGLPVVASDIASNRFAGTLVPGVALVGLDQPTAVWAQAVKDASLDRSTTDRVESFRGTAIDMRQSRNSFEVVWRRNADG